MNIAERAQQILRVKAASFQPELDEILEQTLRKAVLEVVKTTLEAARDPKYRTKACHCFWSPLDQRESMVNFEPLRSHGFEFDD